MTHIEPAFDRKRSESTDLAAENAELRRRLEQATKTIEALRAHALGGGSSSSIDGPDVLQQNNVRFREMIDALPTPIYTTDAEGRITHFNRACVDLSGRTPAIDTDQWCVTWKLHHLDGTAMPHDECPMAIALKTGRIVQGAEAIAERPDGTRIWFTPYPTVLRNPAGQIVGGLKYAGRHHRTEAFGTGDSLLQTSAERLRRKCSRRDAFG